MQNVKTTVTTGGGGLAGRRAWSGGWMYRLTAVRLNTCRTEHRHKLGRSLLKVSSKWKKS